MAVGILMAAGMGTRMRPLTERRPKPLIKICGKPMAETVIEGLQSCGVKKIYVVVGYLKEQFGYLPVKYDNIELVENTQYETVNNISSVYAVQDILGFDDCFICEADLYIIDPSIFTAVHEKSCYYGRMVAGHSDDWVFEADPGGRITRVGKTGDNLFNMAGVAFFKREDALILKLAVRSAYGTFGYEKLFWDEVVNDNLEKLDLRIYPVDGEQIAELDTCEEVKKLEQKLLQREACSEG